MHAADRMLDHIEASLHVDGVQGRAASGRVLHTGAALVRAGDAFRGVWVVRSGCLKSVIVDAAGAQQVVGFAMRGDVVGGDGLASGHYVADIVALDEAEVVPMRGQAAADGTMTAPSIGEAIASQLTIAHSRHTILRALKADARVAAFLLALRDRMPGAGPMHLSMMRAEIGSYLGLSIETVSRSLTKFSAKGLIRVDRRTIEIVDEDGLRTMASKSWNGSREPSKAKALLRVT